MKLSTRSFLMTLLSANLCFAATQAHAAASANGQVGANVVERLTIVSQDPLNFGHLTPTGSGGVVVVSTGNNRSVTGGVQVSGGFSRGSFKVQGTPGSAYSIHTPDSQLFVSSAPNSDPNLVNSLTVDHFVTYSANEGSDSSSGRLSSSGDDMIYLGGRITVPANAVPGVYSGIVPVTVSY